MSKKNVQEQIEKAREQGVSFPPHMGYVLKALGESLINDFQGEHGVFMDKESRKARGNEPLSAVGEGDIKIECLGGTLTIGRERDDRPMWSVPVGQSDKVTTATIPWQKITGYLYQTIISCVGVDYAQDLIMPLINEWIDMGMETTDDGKVKINQDKLPEVTNPIEVAIFNESLKRQFTSKSRGTSSLNLSLELGVADVSVTPPSREDMVKAELHTRRMRAAHNIIGVSNSPPTQMSATDVESIPNPPTQGFTEPSDMGIPEVASSGSQATSTLLDDRANLSRMITKTLGNDKRTIGFLKKHMPMDEKAWRARLEAMIETGEVLKEGERRSCRYFLPEGVIA
tara:strand:+ start:244 stop:1269 length:1026 start_codon:yes stop_codon:yes gene_type:complete